MAVEGWAPEPLQDATPVQLTREMWGIFNRFQQVTDFMVGALPAKGFMMILDGVGGAIGGAANVTLPVIFDQYNIDETFGTGGVIRASEGVYQFKLRQATIADENVLEFVYPHFTEVIPEINLDITAESSRLFLSNADTVTGILEITVQQLEVPASGKGTWTPYDLRLNDRVWAVGLLNLTGSSGDYGDTP